MVTIKEDYVSFETAKLLKEKGFDCECRDYYNTDGHFYSEDFSSNWNDPRSPVLKLVSAPTLQMAGKWLREMHNLCLFVIPATIDSTFRTGYALYPQCDSKWEWCASKNDGSKATFGCDINKDYCDSYEQACEAAIKYCLENLI